MPSFTVGVAGTVADANEVRDRLNMLGMELGYASRRGPFAGRGGAGAMLRDIAEGGAAVLPALSDGDYAWLVILLQDSLAENPDRADFIAAAIKGLIQADTLRQRGPVGRGGGGRIE